MSQSNIEVICQQLDVRIASKSLSLPMLPQVTAQVLALVNNADSDAAALSRLIQSDPALAGHVMRIANSAAYSPTAKMASLQQAIARLGMQNMAEIAMAATMGPKMFQVAGFESLIKDIWFSSLATAVWAREIARQARRNVESTFLCGLLFQIGRPVVLQAVLDISQGDDLEVSPAEVAVLMDTYQAKVGTVLANYWQLPTSVCHTINGAESEEAAEGSQDIVDTVKASRVFAACTTGDRNYDADSLITHPRIVDVNLYADDVQDLISKADSIHDTINMLSI